MGSQYLPCLVLWWADEHHTRPCKLLCHQADGRVYMQSQLRQAAHAGSFQRGAPTPGGGFQYNDTPWGGTLLFFTETIYEEINCFVVDGKRNGRSYFKIFSLFEDIKRVGHRWLSPAPTAWGNQALSMTALC